MTGIKKYPSEEDFENEEDFFAACKAYRNNVSGDAVEKEQGYIKNVKELPEVAELDGKLNTYVHAHGSETYVQLQQLWFKAIDAINKSKTILEDHVVRYLKTEHDFQVIQLDGLNISKDQFFEQRINTAIAMAYKNKSEKEQSKIEKAIEWCDERYKEQWRNVDELDLLEEMKTFLLSLSNK